MTDRELRKLNRKDLLELLISQGRERDRLETELEKAKAALRERQICLEQTGSIAEAALQLNGVFDAAQAAAQQYLESIRLRREETEQFCREHEEEARRKAERQLQEAEETARKMIEDTEKKCKDMEDEAKKGARTCWAETSESSERIGQDHEASKERRIFGGRP